MKSLADYIQDKNQEFNRLHKRKRTILLVECPECGAAIEIAGDVIKMSNPPQIDVKCSSDLCRWNDTVPYF